MYLAARWRSQTSPALRTPCAPFRSPPSAGSGLLTSVDTDQFYINRIFQVSGKGLAGGISEAHLRSLKWKGKEVGKGTGRQSEKGGGGKGARRGGRGRRRLKRKNLGAWSAAWETNSDSLSKCVPSAPPTPASRLVPRPHPADMILRSEALCSHSPSRVLGWHIKFH